MSLIRRASTVLLCFAMLAGNALACAGWAPTAEARMACCMDEAGCPMHEASAHATGLHGTMSQTDADQCCAASEREGSRPPSQSILSANATAVLGPGVVLPAVVPPLLRSDRWRAVLPASQSAVPRHVLLSVFLI